MKPLNKLIRDLKNALENTQQILRLDDDTEYLVTPRQLQIDPCTLSLDFSVCNFVKSALNYVMCTCTETLLVSNSAAPLFSSL